MEGYDNDVLLLLLDDDLFPYGEESKESEKQYVRIFQQQSGKAGRWSRGLCGQGYFKGPGYNLGKSLRNAVPELIPDGRYHEF